MQSNRVNYQSIENSQSVQNRVKAWEQFDKENGNETAAACNEIATTLEESSASADDDEFSPRIDDSALQPPPQLERMSSIERFAASKPRFLGFAMLSGSAAMFSLMTLFVSMSSPFLPSTEIVTFRCAIQFTLALVCLAAKRLDPRGPRHKWPALFMRGLMGVCGFNLFFAALGHLPLGDASVLFFTSPCWTLLLGYLVLHEPVSRYDIVSVIVCMCGVVLIARPVFVFGADPAEAQKLHSLDPSERLVWIGACLLGAVCSASVYVWIRRIGPSVHSLVLVLYLAFIGLLVSPLAASVQTFVWPPNTTVWCYQLGVGVTSFIAQYFFNAGAVLMPAGRANLVRSLDVAFAMILQVTVLGQSMNPWSLLGAAIVMTSVLGVGLRKHHKTHDDERALIEKTTDFEQPPPLTVKLEIDEDEDSALL